MFKNISIIGAGTMGNGIAHVFAQAGYSVNLVDVNESQLEKAIASISKNLDRQILKGTCNAENKQSTLTRITTNTSLSAGVKHADLVVEAASEKTDLKLGIFRELDMFAPQDCILATNTSSISITQIASAIKRPSMVIGMHFMNPVPMMKLVEVINGYATADHVTNTIVQLSKDIGKVPCIVNDYPGFIANRILMPMINEAISSLHEGVAGVEEIDMIMKTGMAHPMGPLQLADFIGLDVCHAILEVLHNGLGRERYFPSPLLTNMVSAGALGVKTGEGFYIYERGSGELRVSERFRKG